MNPIRKAVLMAICRWAMGLSAGGAGSSGGLVLTLPNDALMHLPFGAWLPLTFAAIGSVAQLGASILDKIPDAT